MTENHRAKDRWYFGSGSIQPGSDSGIALLITLLALFVFSALGIYMSFSAVTEVRISDNYETRVQARQAALAGINHARELLRGVEFNDLLRGPDGTYTTTSTYLTSARKVAFRNPLPWVTARSVNVLNPASFLTSLADDGLMNTGKSTSSDGTILIPLTGIAQTAPNPYGDGTMVTSRYFVKVSDNNGEPTELLGDATDNPFVDGDRIIIVRSMGISQTIVENSGGEVRANSVAVYEARFRRKSTWDIDAPLLIEGNDVLPSGPNMFDGNAFDLVGGNSHYGIATIDTDQSSGDPLPDQIKSYVDSPQRNNIQGMGVNPSIGDVTGTLTDPDQLLLLDPAYLYNFVTTEIPLIADSVYQGAQHWSGNEADLDLGSVDIRKPMTDPSQQPRLTYVDGDLDIQGNIEGGGLLVVRGKLTGGGTFRFNGLIMILGQGEMDLAGLNMGVNGGVYIANVTAAEDGTVSFGTPRISLSGNSDIRVHSDALRIARLLLPPTQMGIREITSWIDR